MKVNPDEMAYPLFESNPNDDVWVAYGESKREKAVWQLYAAIVAADQNDIMTFEQCAEIANTAVDAGFAELNKERE